MKLSHNKYLIRQGVIKVRTKIAIAFSAIALIVGSTFLGLAIPFGASAATPYTLTPWTYVGGVDECGSPYPAGTPGNVVSQWDYTQGNPSPSLYLQKSAPTTDCSSAGATINGVAGITLTELNFDYKTGTYCGAGAPRFNVDASDGSHFLGGCANATQTDLGNGWTHVVIDPSNASQAFPVLTPGATINSIEIVFDEQGSTYIDNVSVNDQVISGPNTPVSKDACKKDGWKNLQDSSGKSFKNQGDCVSFVATGGKNQGNGW